MSARESFLPRSAARGCEPGLAEDDGSLSAPSSNTLARLEVIYTPVGVFEGGGKPRLRSPSPLQHSNLAALPGGSSGAVRSTAPGPGCPRAGRRAQAAALLQPAPGQICAPAARGGRCANRQLFSVPLPGNGLGGHGGAGERPLDRAEDRRPMPTRPAAGRGMKKAGSTVTEEGLGRPPC